MERFPVATCLTVVASVLVSGPGLLRWGEEGEEEAADAEAMMMRPLRPPGDSPSPFSLRPEAVREWQVYRLVTYIFVYEDVISLACGAIITWYFAGSFEKNVGTVKHSFFTVAFAVSSALLYLVLRAAVSWLSGVADAEGFAPVAFAMFGASVARSRMKRTLLCGINFRVALVPWLLLGVAWLIPYSSLLGNFCGLFIGDIYGYGFCFGLDLPEQMVSRLDQAFPFWLLKRIPGLKYVPGSLAERRACLSRKLNPVPGSYPTQSYRSSPPPALPAMPVQHPGAHTSRSWPQPSIPAPSQIAGAPGEPSVENHLRAPPDGLPLSSQRLAGPHLWMPERMDCSEGSIAQAPRFPAPGGAPSSAEVCQVRIG